MNAIAYGETKVLDSVRVHFYCEVMIRLVKRRGKDVGVNKKYTRN
jgi:hypothetical protein